MPRILPVETLEHPGLAPYAHLTNPQLRSRLNPGEGLFIAESLPVIGCALDTGCEPVSFLMQENHLRGKAAPLVASLPEDLPVYTGSAELLEKLTGYRLSRGVLAAFRRPKPRQVEELLPGCARVAVLENVVDDANLGAIFRSAAALGIGAVLLSPSCCDPLTRRALRVSMGNILRLPWARFEGTWPEDGLSLLKRYGYQTAALALVDPAIGVEDPRLKEAPRLALLLGTEGDGLEKETIAACDYRVYIPMANGVDSLNVAACAAIAFWELTRK